MSQPPSPQQPKEQAAQQEAAPRRWVCLRCSEAAGVADDPARHISHAEGEACPRASAA